MPAALRALAWGAAGCELVAQQATVELKRPLPTFELGIERLPESAGPHLHRATSCRARAREREGSPRMRMKPAASSGRNCRPW